MIKAVIFDLDGTLTKFNLDINKIKKEIGGNSQKTILEIVESLDAPEREKAGKLLEKYECEAAREAQLNEGVRELFKYLEEMDIKTALVTRNNRNAARIIMEKFGLNFDAIVTREDANPKPSEEQLKLVLKKLGFEKSEVLFVGDHRFDLEAGRKAGISTCLLRGKFSEKLDAQLINSIKDVASLLRE